MLQKLSASQELSSSPKSKTVVANWKDSRGSFQIGFWRNGKFTGFWHQAPATRAEMEANPSFILPGRDAEVVFDAIPDYTPFVWFKDPEQ